MKKHILFPVISFLLLTIIIFNGCKKDSDHPFLSESNLPGVMMTLSAISYVAEDSTATIISDSILHFLSDETLATGGDWQLDWGPVITNDKCNLIFVAKNTSGEIPAYVIAIRGTNVHSLSDILEDIIVIPLVEFPYGVAGDSVAKGPMEGFAKILETSDIASQTTLEEYLKTIPTSEKIPLFITGHSQGGGLAPLFAYWLITNETLKDKFVFSTYAFAGPGWFNKNFRDNFLNKLPADASFQMFVNSLDMIPYGYSNLAGINAKNIPVHVPSPYRTTIAFVDSLITDSGIKYYNIVVADSIGHIPITSSTPGGIMPSNEIKWYNYWLKVEHHHNNYLRLLGVKPVI
jgi:lipase (class 3)